MIANLEKWHRGYKICRETKAKHDKEAKKKKDGSLLTFLENTRKRPFYGQALLVMVTGMDIPGGYTGKGTVGTDKDTYFGIRSCTCTHICHTHTHSGGYGTQYNF